MKSIQPIILYDNSNSSGKKKKNVENCQTEDLLNFNMYTERRVKMRPGPFSRITNKVN